MEALIKNAKGTSKYVKPSTGDASWLDYWERVTGIKTTQCGATDCQSPIALVGAHVKIYGSDKLYITPLCYGCNHRSGYFWVDTVLVRVPNGL